MNEIQLGQLIAVDLREVFVGEATHFTPWLAQEQNLALLGDTIGLDLELVGTEQNVGPYRADIVCKDTLTGSVVLVENQLEKTDHTHLGQILTYTAKFQAVTIVWIASRFTEEHRAALDWLNNNTVSNIQFFGLEVELWRIGTSRAAPKFNIVSQPNDWVKTAGIAQDDRGDLTETQQWQLEYWTAFRDYILTQGSSVIKMRTPPPRYWVSFPIGRSGFDLSTNAHQPKQRVNVTLGLYGRQAKAHFHLLKANKEAIEAQLGAQLTWHELPDKQASYVSLYLPDTNPLDRNDWPRQHEWLLTKLEDFYRVFAPQVKTLKASDWVRSPSEPMDEPETAP